MSTRTSCNSSNPRARSARASHTCGERVGAHARKDGASDEQAREGEKQSEEKSEETVHRWHAVRRNDSQEKRGTPAKGAGALTEQRQNGTLKDRWMDKLCTVGVAMFKSDVTPVSFTC